MYDCTICKEPSNRKFKAARSKIEKAYPNAEKSNLLIDVDGSLVQEYGVDGKKIILQNDFEVGAVYVESEIDLSEIFD